MSAGSAWWGKRSLVTFAVGAVVLGGVQGPPAVADSTDAPCDAVAASDAEAVQVAARCGEDVEVLDARTEWATLYAQPDGQMRLESSIDAVRTKVSGEWAGIDASLVVGTQGVTMVSPAVQMTFSGGADDQPLVRMERDGHELTFDVPFDLPEPVVSGGTVEYQAVLPDVDLLVTPDRDGSGFSEVLRVASPQAAADPAIQSLAFPIAVSDELTLSAVGGGFVARDTEGEQVFASPAPAMWDSSTDEQAPKLSASLAAVGSDAAASSSLLSGLHADRAARVEGPLDGDQRSMLESKLSADAVSVTPDEGMLSDPDTVWPVYIDPVVGVGSSERVGISSTGWSHYQFSDEGMGRCGTTGSPMYCREVFTERLVYQFTGLQPIGDVDPGDLTSAVMSVYGSSSYSCTAYPVEAWWTGGINSGATWSNVSWLAGLSTQVVAHKAACGNQRNIEWNVLGGAQQTAAQNAAQLTLGLKAADESSSTGWKRYGGATLTITYNQAPSTPSALSITSPKVTCGGVVNSATPTLSATAQDPNGDTITTTFEVRNAAGTKLWSTSTGSQASGSAFAVKVPAGVLADAGSYGYVVRATDTGGRVSAWSGTCAFTANTVPPSTPPTVTAVTGQPAVYSEGQRSGGVGVVGRFSFGTNGVGDVRTFRYGFDDSAMASSVGLNVQVSYTPTKAGTHTLYVQSVDAGGLAGPRRDYQFTVDVPGAAGLWLFDESGAPASATDSSGAGHPLTLSSATLRVPGVLAELDPSGAPANDGALHLASAGDQATSAAPVVATAGSYTVTAFVKVDDLTAAQTAVSQGATHTSAFELGVRPAGDPACPGAEACWAFTLAGADSASAPSGTTVASGVPVAAGQWVFLAAEYDAAAGVARLYVADPGGEPVASGDVPVPAGGLFSAGAFVVGHGLAADI
ncbi:MAG: LamG domain-containing protein, partial [Cellulomonadaceae bacterium]|nr:LamG domain-containing protein [Cellulomonadaceae bacterium]